MTACKIFLQHFCKFKVSPSNLVKYSANRSYHSTGGVYATGNSDDTLGGVIRRWSQRFEEEGVPEPVGSIEHIAAHVIGKKRIIDLVNSFDRRMTADEVQRLESLCECRLSRMPVQYIIGEWDFRDITLKLVPPIFIPRPETEFFIDFILKRLSESPDETLRVLEIGTGSGAISLALAHACDKVRCIAIDQNPHACDLARENCRNLKLEDRISIVNAALEAPGRITDVSGDCGIDFEEEKFDFIVSNPPYIPTKKIMELEPEIKVFEDIRALDGGPDGLKLIKPIMRYASTSLKPGGHLFLEVDSSHGEYIKFFTEKFTDLNLKFGHIYKDYCNNDRFIEITKLN
ncbi:MTRF1L release factor glutamine methyltransferase [Diachasma alloeum]|uniref:MTRF1L release factor glutamine methyltransferase n=1 Tax=Diachasma alloeum TaxID=454923 RepID=UPI0007381103|nr:MTRF1L release factor glutamine methyltransferase [Diachasma alloeum]